MPVVTPEKLAALQRNPNDIRNVRVANLYENQTVGTDINFRFVF